VKHDGERVSRSWASTPYTNPTSQITTLIVFVTVKYCSARRGRPLGRCTGAENLGGDCLGRWVAPPGPALHAKHARSRLKGLLLQAQRPGSYDPCCHTVFMSTVRSCWPAVPLNTLRGAKSMCARVVCSCTLSHVAHHNDSCPISRSEEQGSFDL
jgi:hypothetical protein